MDRDAYLLHQVHPLKLATDIAASVVSSKLFWEHRFFAGLVAALGPPVVASALIVRSDLGWLRETAPGRYVLANMPPSAQAVRLAGAALMAYGAWRHRRDLVALSLAAIVAGWSRGALRRS